MMAFWPTFTPVPKGAAWSNEMYNNLVSELESYLGSIDGTTLSAPLVLDTDGQNLDGGGNLLCAPKGVFGAYGATRGQMCLNVIGYGADPTGAAESATAILAAIADLPSDGGVLLFPPGKYLLTQYGLGVILDTIDNITFQGFGPASVFIMPNSIPGNVNALRVGNLGSSNVTKTLIQDIAFDGNVDTHPGTFNTTLLDVTGVAAGAVGPLVTKVFDVVFKNSGSGIAVNTKGDYRVAHVDGCLFDDIGPNGTGTGSIIQLSSQGTQVDGIQLSQCIVFESDSKDSQVTECEWNLLISDNVFYGTDDTYPAFELLNSSNPLSGLIVEGNVIDRYGYGLTFASTSFYPLVDLSIANSVCGNLVQGIGIIGIQASCGTQDAGLNSGLRYVTISNNLFVVEQENFGFGIVCLKQSNVSPGICFSLMGNVVVDAVTWGMRVEGNDGTGPTNRTYQFSLLGNAVVNTLDISAMTYGISLDDRLVGSPTYGPNDCQVLGNIVYGATNIGIREIGYLNDIAHNSATVRRE
jgi:hypothetical protein